MPIMRREPTPPELFARFEDFFGDLYEIVEASIEVGLDDFVHRGRPVEAFHHASTVRNEAKNRLRELKDGAFAGQIVDLPNNGLLILHDAHAFRFLKSDGPLPGAKTDAMGEYHGQNLTLALEWLDKEDEILIADHDLVILWSMDEKNRLKNLRLVMPGEAGWNEVIPRRVAIRVAPVEAESENTEDLPFEVEAQEEAADRDKKRS
jgi:hypothetical protein